MKSDEWISRSDKLRKLLEAHFDTLSRTSNPFRNLTDYKEKSIEKEIQLACGKELNSIEKSHFVVEKNKLVFFRSLAEFESSLEKMLVVFREWKDRPATAGAEQMKTFLRTKLPSDNQLTLQ